MKVKKHVGQQKCKLEGCRTKAKMTNGWRSELRVKEGWSFTELIQRVFWYTVDWGCTGIRHLGNGLAVSEVSRTAWDDRGKWIFFDKLEKCPCFHEFIVSLFENGGFPFGVFAVSFAPLFHAPQKNQIKLKAFPRLVCFLSNSDKTHSILRGSPLPMKFYFWISAALSTLEDTWRHPMLFSSKPHRFWFGWACWWK